jgi:PTH1 family peptidyl-tRNA hydrolase
LWIVVGLGNPGRRYSRTRHNAGFLFIKKLAREWKVKLKRKKYLAKAGEVVKSDERVRLVIPQTFMNESGKVVSEIMDELRISPENFVIVYDDLDIPVGEIRVRKEGSPGTHRGMNSIVRELESTKFPRIRLGIGSSLSENDVTSFVLSSFNKEEKHLLQKSLEKAQEALEMILAGEIEKAMNIFNKKKTLLN